jgi:AsmA-like C-terminal region
MKKIFRKLMIAGGVFLVLVFLLVAVTTQLFPVEKVSRRVEAELEKATGAEVSIGSAGIHWWPKFGVDLTDFRIIGTGEDLTRANGSVNEIGKYSARLDRFLVQVPVLPLLKKEILVDATQIKGLNLEMEFREEPYVLEGADLYVKDLQISVEAASEAGQTQSGSPENKPVGEMIPEDLILTFQGEVKKLTAKGLPLEDIQFNGDLDTRVLTIEDIVASVGTGRLMGNLEIDYERDPAGVLEFDFEAQKVPAGALLQPWAAALGEKLETDLDGKVSGVCTLGDKDVVNRTLNLGGQLGSGAGTLWARQWLEEVAPYLGDRQDLQDIRFRSLTHHLRVENGKYLVEKLEIDGLETVWQGKGFVGLDGTMDLDVKVKLPAGFTPDLGQWSFLADTLRDQDGRVNLDIHLSGMAAKPEVGLNLGSLQDAAKSDAGEAVKKGLGGLLDKWKNR